MPDKITITDDEIKYLNQPAVDELKLSLVTYKKAIISEASRLETNNKTTNGDPEITSTHIKDAVTLLNRGYKNPKKKLWFYIVKISGVLLALITGFLFEKLSEPWGPITFALALAITTIVVTIQVFTE